MGPLFEIVRFNSMCMRFIQWTWNMHAFHGEKSVTPASSLGAVLPLSTRVDLRFAVYPFQHMLGLSWLTQL